MNEARAKRNTHRMCMKMWCGLLARGWFLFKWTAKMLNKSKRCPKAHTQHPLLATKYETKKKHTQLAHRQSQIDPRKWMFWRCAGVSRARGRGTFSGDDWLSRQMFDNFFYFTTSERMHTLTPCFQCHTKSNAYRHTHKHSDLENKWWLDESPAPSTNTRATRGVCYVFVKLMHHASLVNQIYNTLDESNYIKLCVYSRIYSICEPSSPHTILYSGVY